MNKVIRSLVAVMGSGSIITPVFPGTGGGIVIDPGIIKPVSNDAGISSFDLSPLSISGKTSYGSLKVNFGITYKPTIKVSVYIINSLFPSGKLIYSVTTSKSTECDFSFEYDNSYTDITNSIKIERNVNGTIKTFISAIDLAEENVLVLNESNYTYKTPSHILHFDGMSFSTKSITYSFSNFESIYYPNEYHNINLGDYRINLSSSLIDFVFSDSYFFLSNINGIYNNMPLNGEYLRVPIAPNKEPTNSEYSIKLKDFYYIDPKTYLMSSTMRQGYLETDYIYFPNSEMSNLSNYKAGIVFYDFGVEHARVTYNFSFYSLLSLLGNCIDSEYCIRVKDVEPNDNGWIL